MATQGGGTTVPISFPTNTVGLETAINLMKQSKTATDQLRDSTKKLGTDTQAAGRQVSSTLEGMNLRLAQLKGQISLTSTSNTAQLQKLSSEYKALQAEIDRTNKKLFEQQKAVQDSTKAVDGNSQSWMSLVRTVRLFIAAAMVREITSITLEMTKLSGQIEGVSRAFNKIPNATLLLEQLRQATHGTVTDLELMQNAIKFQNFRLPLQDLSKYLEFASIRAQQTGESIDYMMNSIITGLGRGSIKILDNLQINVTALREDMQRTGATIQEAFGRQVQQEMIKLGGYIETGATNIEQMNRNAKQLFATISQKLEQSSFIRFIARELDYFNKGLQTREKLIEDVASKEVAALVKAREAVDKTSKEKSDILENEIQRRKDLVYQIRLEAAEAQKAEKPGALAAFRDSDEQKRINAMKTRADVIEKTIGIIREYIDTTNALDDSDKNNLVTIETMRQKVDALREEFEQSVNFFDNKTYIAKATEIRQLEEEIARRENLLSLKQPEHNASEQTNKDLQVNYDELMKVIGAWRKLDEEAIPTLNNIEEDTKETTDFVMGAWQEFFARFRIGWTQSGKHFKNEQAEMNDVINQIKENAFSTTQTLLNNTLNAEVNSYNQRIINARSYYDREIELAGDNERAKIEIQKKRDKELAKLEKQREEAATRAAKRKVYIDTAIAIARAFADYEYPYSLIVAALAGASAVAQIDQINKAPKGYAKGVIGLKGPGTETSDSIPAMLSKNESVMTAQETRDSYKTLHKIRAGKLNDKVLDKILMGNVTVVGSDDSRTAEKLDQLIKEVKANRPPDYVEKAGILYKVQTKGSNSKRYIRSKYGNFN